MESSNASTGVREASVSDLFRRDAFSFALATKRLLDSSKKLTRKAKVAQTAVDDIEFARKLLAELVIPGVEADFSVGEPLVLGLAPVVILQKQEALKVKRERSVPRQKAKPKMTWMSRKCPQCHVPPGKRCQSLGLDPHEIEKPHTPRKIEVEAA